MLRLFGALLAVALTYPLCANAQAWQQEWNATLAKAKSQHLMAMVAAEETYTILLGEFSKRHGIRVETTSARPSSALARIQTEQRSGQYVWDVWMGGTSNMVNTAAPAGLLSKMEPYFILPEVKDASNWRHADYLFGDAQRQVFTSANRLEFYVLRNTSVLPDVKLETWDDFLNPRFKGRISMRDLSVPNGGTFIMATMLNAKGPDFVRKLMKDQEPKIYENPQQLEMAITRGGQAVSIGLEGYLRDKCQADGGCDKIDQLQQFAATTSAGLTVPKNPPHPEAMKVFVNWFLSKDGQEVWVASRAKYQTSGAVSMRKDVAPAKGHEETLPDFSKPQNYVFVSSDSGSEVVNAMIKIFKDVTGH
jgi:ABC-type Fe3+ transport system substrate-binding protein